MIIRLAVVISILAVAVRASQSGTPEEFTPVVISALTATTHSVSGTDAKQHVVYELLVTNANATPAILQKIEVVDGHNPSSVIAAYDGHELLSRLRTTAHGSVDNTEIEYNGTRLFLIDLAFDSEAVVPERLEHRVSILGGASPSLTATTPVLSVQLMPPIRTHFLAALIGLGLSMTPLLSQTPAVLSGQARTRSLKATARPLRATETSPMGSRCCAWAPPRKSLPARCSPPW